MSIKINYSKTIKGKILSNLVLFSNEKFNLGTLKGHLSNSEFSYISDLLKTIDLKKTFLCLS